ncbi:MAG TPA: hypothetical protein VEK07_06955 [Polyangiaceae bacterium]|nr:hypothetical protein [Polyangiaceae bacterium]
MRAVLGTLGCLLLSGCLQGTSSTDGGAVAAASGSSATGEAAAGTAAGSDCTEQPGGIILCEQIDVCPGVDVDPGALPNCGFRLGGAASVDLECECSGLLCPIGVPESCENAAQLLQGQSSLVVCEQTSQGLCLGTGASDGGNAGAASGCDTVCESECAGAPGCIQACGC